MLPLDSYSGFTGKLYIMYNNYFPDVHLGVICNKLNNININEVHKILVSFGFKRISALTDLSIRKKNRYYTYIDVKKKIIINFFETNVNGVRYFNIYHDQNNINDFQIYKTIYRKVKALEKSIDKKPKVFLIGQNSNGFNLHNINIIDNEINIEDNYNDDFLPIHNLITQKLDDEKSNSLIIFQSDPGMGKTFYIRKLIKQFPDKDFVFLSPQLSSRITEPQFIEFAINYLRNTVLIIEDAEMILTKRGNTGNNSAVSVLLNMTDGMMKDALKLKIICTANCKMSDIDEALLRKGRILTKYEFKKLSIDKTNALLKKLNKNFVSTQEMSLCDIYNVEDDAFSTIKNKIGFK